MAILLALLRSYVKRAIPDIFDIDLFKLTDPDSSEGEDLNDQAVADLVLA